MGILSEYQDNQRLQGVESIDIPDIQLPGVEELDALPQSEQQLTAPPQAPMPDIPKIDTPFQDIEFDTNIPRWESQDAPEPTLPSGSNVVAPFVQNLPASQILQNTTDSNGALRNPILESIANLFGIRKGYEENYAKTYGQLGAAGPLFYLLGLPFQVPAGVGADLGRIGAAGIGGVSAVGQNFARDFMSSGGNINTLGALALSRYNQGYQTTLEGTDDGREGTYSQRALLGNQLSFSDERVTDLKQFSPFGLLPEASTYRRAPDLTENPGSLARKIRRGNFAAPLINGLIGIIGVPVQTAIDIATGGFGADAKSKIELPRMSDWLADRINQAEQDPNNYYRSLAGFGLDAIFEAGVTDVTGYVNGIVRNSRKAVPTTGGLALQNRNSGLASQSSPTSNIGNRQPLFAEPPIDVEFRTVERNPALPGQRMLPGQAESPRTQRALPGQPLLPSTSDRTPFSPVNPPRPPRYDLIPETPTLSIQRRLPEVPGVVSPEIPASALDNLVDEIPVDAETAALFDTTLFDDVVAQSQNTIEQAQALRARIDAADEALDIDGLIDTIENGFDNFDDYISIESVAPVQSLSEQTPTVQSVQPDLSALLPSFIQNKPDKLAIYPNSRYGVNAYSVSVDIGTKFTDFVKWFKQSLADPEFDGTTLIMDRDSIGEFGTGQRVTKVLERLGWDGNLQFGYARFDNINMRGITDTTGEILVPSLRKDRMRWKRNQYVRQISEYFGTSDDLWYNARYNDIYDAIDRLRRESALYSEETVRPPAFDEYYRDLLQPQSNKQRDRVIRQFLTDNYPGVFELTNDVREKVTSIILDSNPDNRQFWSNSLLTDAMLQDLGNNPDIQRLVQELSTPDVINFDDAAIAITRRLPLDMRAPNGGLEYRYSLQELINSDAELETAIGSLNQLQDNFAQLSEPLNYNNVPTEAVFDATNRSAIFPSREINATLRRGDVVLQDLNRAKSTARQPVQTPQADLQYGAPSVTMFDFDDNLRVMDADSFSALRQQLTDLQDQFDEDTYAQVYESILGGLSDSFDILPDGTVINPGAFFENLRQALPDTDNAIELRAESYNSLPNNDNAGNLAAQLLDEIENRIDQGNAALDDAITRNEQAEDTLRDIATQQRETLFSNPEDFPERVTDELYSTEVTALIDEDPGLRYFAEEEAVAPSSSFQRIWNEYTEEIFDALENEDPDTIIEAAIAFRETHNLMWEEAATLYENAIEAYTELNRRQGIWVPSDLFPLLEDIC